MKNGNKVKAEKNGRLLVRFTYSNGHYEIREFATDKDLGWFTHNEGEHLIDWEIINNK